MNKNLVKSRFAVMFLSLALAVSVFVFFSLDDSVAWFSNNDEVGADGFQIGLKTGADANATVLFYDAVSVNSSGTVTFDLSNGKTSVELPKYDLLDEASHYVLAKISLKEAYTLTISTDTTYILDKSKPLLGGDGVGEEYSNWLSSILFFEQVSVPSDAGAVTVTEEDKQSFVQKSDYSFDGEKEISFPVRTGGDLYLVIGYDSDLMNKIFSENIGNSNISDADVINYINDCKFVISLGGVS